MNRIFLGCIISLAIACEAQVPNGIEQDSASSPTRTELSSRAFEPPDTVGFLNNCSQLLARSSQGALQGTNAGVDSTNYLCFAACYTCSVTYEVIFVYKGGVKKRKSLGYAEIWESFQKGCEDSFQEFDCFAFTVPLRDPEKQKDIHSMNMDFPSTASAYHRISGDTWKFVGGRKVHAFEEYANFQFETIYFTTNKN